MIISYKLNKYYMKTGILSECHVHKVRVEGLLYADDAWCTAGEGRFSLTF